MPSRFDHGKVKQHPPKQDLKKHVKKTFDEVRSNCLLSERTDTPPIAHPPEFVHITQGIAIPKDVAKAVPIESITPIFVPLTEKSVPDLTTHTSKKEIKATHIKTSVLAAETAKKKTRVTPIVKNHKANLLDINSEKSFKTPNFMSSDGVVAHTKEIDEAKFSKREIQRERRRIEKEEKRRAREISVAELAAEKHFRPQRFRALRWAVSLVLVAAVGFVIYDTARTNFDMRAYMSRPREAGVYDTVTIVSEEPISKSDMKYHSVGKADPRYITIDSAGINARVLSAGADEYGRILPPQNIFDVSWYNESVRPGAVGAMVMSGYMSGPTQPGAFSKSSKIKVGDYITIERGDGIKINYIIEKIETMRVEDVNIEEIFQVYSGASHGLNLIINTGNWAQGNLDNSDRTVIYSVASQN